MGRGKGDGIVDKERGPLKKEDPPENPESGSTGGRGRVWIPIVALVVVPSLLYAAIPVVAFLPLSAASKVWVSGGLVVAAEVIFVVSAIFLGKEVVSRYRRYLDPRTWFRKR